MIYFGLHYDSCPIEVREYWTKISLTQDDHLSLKLHFENHELILFSTCNRFDILLSASWSPEQVTKSLLEFGTLQSAKLNVPMPKQNLSSVLRYFMENDAIRQLFRVASSLDSLVLGEPQILGQIKDAYRNQNHLFGNTIRPVMDAAFQTAKTIRARTGLGQHGVSIGHAAVEVSKRIFESLSSLHALVIGAGEMGRIIAQNLKSCGVSHICVANRTQPRLSVLQQELPYVLPILLDEALERAHEFPLIIVATSSQQFVLTQQHVKKQLPGGKTRVVVDVSVPRNVDPRVSSANNTFLFDVDDLDQVMQTNRSARQEAAVVAESIVESEVTKFTSRKRHRIFQQPINHFHALVNETVKQEITKHLTRNASKNLPMDQDVIAQAVSKKLTSRIIHVTRNRHESDAAGLSNEQLQQALEILFLSKASI